MSNDLSIDEKTGEHGQVQTMTIKDSTRVSEERALETHYTAENNLVYDDADEEPELHARTYIALISMFFLNLVQVVALQGPPAVVSQAIYNVVKKWSHTHQLVTCSSLTLERTSTTPPLRLGCQTQFLSFRRCWDR